MWKPTIDYRPMLLQYSWPMTKIVLNWDWNDNILNRPLKGHKLQHFLQCQSTCSSLLQSRAKLDGHCRATWLQISGARKVLYGHCMYTTINMIHATEFSQQESNQLWLSAYEYRCSTPLSFRRLVGALTVLTVIVKY